MFGKLLAHSDGESSNSFRQKYSRFNVKFDSSARESIYSTLIALLENDRNVVVACGELAVELREKGVSKKVISFFDDVTDRTRYEPFEDAIDGWVPESEAMLIKTGADTGSVLDGIREALVLLRNNKEISGAILGAAIGPFFMVLSLFGLLMLVSFALMPIMLDVAPIDTWPTESKPFYYFTTFLKSNAVFVAIGLVSILFLMFSTLNTFVGKARRYFDRVPPWAIHRRVSATIFLNSLAAIISQNIKLNDALEMLRPNAPGYTRSHIDGMLNEMGISGSPGKSLTCTKFFNPEISAIISCIAGDGAFSEKVRYISTREMKGVLEWTKVLSKVFNVTMLILIALSLVWSLSSILFVIWTFYTDLQATAFG